MREFQQETNFKMTKPVMMLEATVLKENSLLFTFIVDAQNTKSVIDKQKKLKINILFSCSPMADKILLFVFFLLDVYKIP